MVEGSELYERQIKSVVVSSSWNGLMRKVWDETPWMVDVYTGPISNFGRYREIMDWCWGRFGRQASPIHGKPGDWQMGGVTLYGWTWMGFKTKEMMEEFLEFWSS